MSDLVYLRVINEFFDEEAGVWRSQTKGLFPANVERARKLIDEGVAELAIGTLEESDDAGTIEEWDIEDEETSDEGEEMESKALAGPPENRSLSGPPENKLVERLQEQNVDTLRKMLEEEYNVDLPSGYIRKEELITMIREEESV